MMLSSGERIDSTVNAPVNAARPAVRSQLDLDHLPEVIHDIPSPQLNHPLGSEKPPSKSPFRKSLKSWRTSPAYPNSSKRLGFSTGGFQELDSLDCNGTSMTPPSETKGLDLALPRSDPPDGGTLAWLHVFAGFLVVFNAQ